MPHKFPQKPLFNIVEIIGEKLSGFFGERISAWGFSNTEIKNNITTNHIIDIKKSKRLYIEWVEHPSIEDILKVENFINKLNRR